MSDQPNSRSTMTEVTDSSGRLHRLNLRHELSDTPRRSRITFVMLNPSTADLIKDDPTVRRCRRYALREGFDSFSVVNLFSIRATDPRELLIARIPSHPRNTRSVLHEARIANRVIAAWGGDKAIQNQRALIEKLRAAVDLYCLKINQSGAPSHPLYLRKDAPFIRWPGYPSE